MVNLVFENAYLRKPSQTVKCKENYTTVQGDLPSFQMSPLFKDSVCCKAA